MSKLDYVISYETMLLEPADHPEYLTKIIDTNKGILYSKRTAKSLMKDSALTYHYSIKGHLEIVKHKYPTMKKIPLMINPTLSILMIPTASPNQSSCKWLNFIQIDQYRPMKKQTNIRFKDGTEILLPISYYIFDQQMSKAAKLIGIYIHQKVEYEMKSEEEKLLLIKELVADIYGNKR